MKKQENGCTTTTSANEEVKFYVDLSDNNEISKNKSDLIHIDCTLNPNEPYYYVEATNSLDEISEINPFTTPQATPSDFDYEVLRDACVDDAIDYTIEFNDNIEDEDKKTLNVFKVVLKKATIIFDEKQQKYVLSIDNLKSDKFTIYPDGGVEEN